MELSAIQIATLLGGTVVGNQNVTVNNYSKIEEGKPGTLSFLANPKYESYIYEMTFVKILSEIVGSDVVLAAYSTGDFSLIIKDITTSE